VPSWHLKDHVTNVTWAEGQERLPLLSGWIRQQEQMRWNSAVLSLTALHPTTAGRIYFLTVRLAGESPAGGRWLRLHVFAEASPGR
jgi:hypothetical protein